MKAESLFHLLQIRARKLEEGAEPSVRRQLRAVQAELKVSHSRGWFEVTWRHDGRDFSLNVPEHDFTFYVTGDTAKAVEQRGATGNVRLRNWQAAAALWQRLAEVSGFAIPPADADSAMGLAPAATHIGFKGHPLVVAAIVAGIGTIATGVHQGWIFGIGAGVIALLLAALTLALLDTQLRRAFSMPEIAIVSAGAFIPALFMGSSLWLIPLLGGLLVMAWLERAQVDLSAAWAAGGLLTAASSYWLGFTTLFPVFALGTALIILRLLTSRRIAGSDAGWFLAGGIFGLIVATAVDSQTIPTTVGGSMALPAVVGIVLLFAFVLWPFHGMLFLLIPWLAIGTLGLASLSSLLADSAMATGSLAVAGFAVVVAKRVIAAFAGAMTARPVAPAKAIKD